MHPIVKRMYEQDAFSQWLGIEVIQSSPGISILKMRVRPEMTNGFDIAHGGITYALADSALAFASNAHGRQAVSIETQISHVEPVHTGDELTAEVTEEVLGHRIARYRIDVRRQDGSCVALFQGSVYRSSKEW